MRRKYNIIGSDNAGILLIGPLATNFSENLIEIHIFSSIKLHLKRSCAKWRPFCLDLNVSIPFHDMKTRQAVPSLRWVIDRWISFTKGL